MATFRLRRFSSPHILQAIDPPRLLRFLDPFRDYLAGRGVALPPAGTTGPIDHDRLVEVFLAPEAGPPKELLDALFFVDEMATPPGMDALIAAAGRARLALDERPDQSPADVAVQVWLLDRQLLESEHAQQYLYRPRSFEYYQTGRAEVPPFVMPPAARFRALERELDDWFEERRRGRGTRVFAYQRDDAVWFLVRHGEPYKREESLDGPRTASVCYRPLRYDVLVYEQAVGELRINARSVRERDLYRTHFGHHVFGDPHFFPGDEKYSLDPLLRRGEPSLVCADVAGLEWVRLREVHVFWGGAEHAVEIHRADNVFRAMDERGVRLPETARLVRAVFQVKFTDSRRPRSVTIRPSNVAQYTRDDDAELIEQWLRRRGFILTAEQREEAAHGTLASA